MYRVGICDDGENICTQLENMLIQWARKNNVRIDVSIWYTGDGLKKYVSAGNSLDIVFLDIVLFGLNGIEVGEYIRNGLDNMAMQIVYISEKASYAQQLFRTQPLDFLVKPILQEHVDDVMARAIRAIRKKGKKFDFQIGRDYYYVPMIDIIYFESEGRKVRIITQKQQFEIYGKLKDIREKLNEEFIAIHQSYVVNRDYISRYSYETVELMDGTTLSISLSYRKQVRKILLQEENI